MLWSSCTVQDGSYVQKAAFKVTRAWRVQVTRMHLFSRLQRLSGLQKSRASRGCPSQKQALIKSLAAVCHLELVACAFALIAPLTP